MRTTLTAFHSLSAGGRPCVPGPRAGFSLVEVIVGLAVLAVVALSLMALFLCAQATQTSGFSIARAANVANAELLRLKTLPFATLEAAVTTPLASRQVDQGNVRYTLTSSLTRVSADANALEYRLLRIRVLVVWEDIKSATLSQERAHVERVGSSLAVESVTSAEASY